MTSGSSGAFATDAHPSSRARCAARTLTQNLNEQYRQSVVKYRHFAPGYGQGWFQLLPVLFLNPYRIPEFIIPCWNCVNHHPAGMFSIPDDGHGLSKLLLLGISLVLCPGAHPRYITRNGTFVLRLPLSAAIFSVFSSHRAIVSHLEV